MTFASRFLKSWCWVWLVPGLWLPQGPVVAAEVAPAIELAAISSDYRVVDELTASRENVGRAFEVSRLVADRLAPLFDLPIVVAVLERKEVSPMLSAVTGKGDCIVVINRDKHAWSYWEPFLVHGVLTVDELFEFAALHEIAHCFNKLGPDSNYMDYLSEGRPSESFSDIFALSLMSEVREDFEMKRIVDALLEIRSSHHAIGDASHNTSNNIRKVYDQLIYKTPSYKNIFLLANHAIKLADSIE